MSEPTDIDFAIRYEVRLPTIIDDFHGDILESIKLYSKRLERED